jgi:hypothetical protein
MSSTSEQNRKYIERKRSNQLIRTSFFLKPSEVILIRKALGDMDIRDKAFSMFSRVIDNAIKAKTAPLPSAQGQEVSNG